MKSNASNGGKWWENKLVENQSSDLRQSFLAYYGEQEQRNEDGKMERVAGMESILEACNKFTSIILDEKKDYKIQ